MAEARELTEKRMREIAAMPFDALVGFIDDPVETETTGPSGRPYRVKTYAFWDMEPEESDLYVRVKVTGRGLRLFQRYLGVDVRGPEDDFKGSSIEESVDVSATWTESLAFAILGLVVIALITSWVVGVAYLISR
jgi:hypothetical protein